MHCEHWDFEIVIVMLEVVVVQFPFEYDQMCITI